MSFVDSTSAWASASRPSNPPANTNGRSAPISESDDGSEEEEFVYNGSYSAQMDELLGDDASDRHDQDQVDIRIVEHKDDDDEDEDDEEDFVYSGVDASNDSSNYREQLREVLDQDHSDDEEEEQEVREVETSLTQETEPDTDEDPLVCRPNSCQSLLGIYLVILA